MGFLGDQPFLYELVAAVALNPTTSSFFMSRLGCMMLCILCVVCVVSKLRRGRLRLEGEVFLL